MKKLFFVLTMAALLPFSSVCVNAEADVVPLEVGYDDPTYMTFKVEFGDWGASVLPRTMVNNGITAFRAGKADYDP